MEGLTSDRFLVKLFTLWKVFITTGLFLKCSIYGGSSYQQVTRQTLHFMEGNLIPTGSFLNSSLYVDLLTNISLINSSLFRRAIYHKVPRKNADLLLVKLATSWNVNVSAGKTLRFIAHFMQGLLQRKQVSHKTFRSIWLHIISLSKICSIMNIYSYFQFSRTKLHGKSTYPLWKGQVHMTSRKILLFVERLPQVPKSSKKISTLRRLLLIIPLL